MTLDQHEGSQRAPRETSALLKKQGKQSTEVEPLQRGAQRASTRVDKLWEEFTEVSAYEILGGEGRPRPAKAFKLWTNARSKEHELKRRQEHTGGEHRQNTFV